jgi:flagellar hook-associated protein 3 FlgL
MVFRVTQFQNDTQFLFNHTNARDNEARVLERLSTLKKVNRSSDNPEHYNRIANAKTDLNDVEKFTGVIENTLSQFTFVEDAFNGIRDALDDAREITLRGTSHLHDDEERETIADELRDLRLTIINRLNTRHEGQYIFSGTDVDVQPFQDTATGNYSGNTDIMEVRINESDRITTNFIGSEVAFGPGGQGSADDMLDVLADLETAYRANDVTTINAEITRMRPIQERMNQIISEVGTRSARVVAERNHYDAFETDLRAVLAQLEDVDLAEEALNLEAAQTTINAQLRTQGTINRQSLLDFIG